MPGWVGSQSAAELYSKVLVESTVHSTLTGTVPAVVEFADEPKGSLLSPTLEPPD